MTSFKVIRARAEKRKGGPKALEKLLHPPAGAKHWPSSATTACWLK